MLTGELSCRRLGGWWYKLAGCLFSWYAHLVENQIAGAELVVNNLGDLVFAFCSKVGEVSMSSSESSLTGEIGGETIIGLMV